MGYGQSQFPTQVDDFIQHYDISASDVQDVQRYQELKLKENRTVTEDNELANLVSQLRGNLFTPEDFNKLQDAVKATQIHYRDEVDGYVTTKQTEMQDYVDTKKTEVDTKVDGFNTYVDNTETDMTSFVNTKKSEVDSYINTETTQFDNKLNRFSYQGVYDSNTQYYQWNTVKYNGSTYLAIQDSIGKAPTLTTYWAKMADKGDKGDQGLAGMGLTFRGAYNSTTTYNPEDAVEYNGSVYFAVNQVVGETPNVDSPNWDLFLNKGAITVSSTQPSNPTNKQLWVDYSNTSNPLMKLYDIDSATWVEIGVTKDYVKQEIDNAKIPVSTTAPSSPSDKDLWIDIS